jgi:hypothetical protein
MDFTVDQPTLNFITPMPPKLDALEEHREDRFSIPQLKCLLEEMQLVSKTQGNIVQVTELANLLFTKIKMSNQFGGIESSLSVFWDKLAWHDILRILRNLDQGCQGEIDWRTLFNYMALEKSPVPASLDMQGLRAENGFAEKQDFVAHKWWFAKSEGSADRDYSLTFERVQMISEMLFEANKTSVEGGREVINLGEFERKMTVCAQEKGKAVTFHDLLFGEVHL